MSDKWLFSRLQIVIVVFAFVIASSLPGWCVAQKVVSEGGPYVCGSATKLEHFTATIKIPKSVVNAPLYLTFYNGYGAKPGYSWVRVFLSPPGQTTPESGDVLADEHTFLRRNALTVDVSGSLSPDGNQLYIEGEGEPGAIFNWILTSVKNNLTVIECTNIIPGKDCTIHGTGFSANATDNKVMIDGKSADVVSASAGMLFVKPPDGIDSKNVSVTVSVNGTVSNPISVATRLTPHLLTMSPYGGPMGGLLNIQGTNFSRVPSENLVKIGPFTAPVDRILPDGTLICTIPDWGEAGNTLPLRVITNGIPSNNTLQFWCMSHYYGGDPNAAIYQYD